MTRTKKKTKAVSAPKPKDVKIELYFDANYVCLGGRADDWWLPNYSGEYYYTNSLRLNYGFNPVSKSELTLMLTCSRRDYTLISKPAGVTPVLKSI